MSKKPPNRPGITFEIGARLEALDYLQKWYPSRIEKIDYEEGKMLVHFERWSHRYDEWIYWDSNRLRPLERPALRKEGLKDEEEFVDFKAGEEVLARWTDCRYYPAKIEAINKEGTFTVQFYDGVIRCLKRMHIKSMPEDAKGQAREREQIAPELRLVTEVEPKEDWIALVKAAAAAAKNKVGSKPRTSANSNKDKEDRKWLKVPTKKEESSTAAIMQDVQRKEEEPTSSDTFAGFPVVDVPKLAFVQAESTLSHKRKSNLGNSFQAKRARLNKITGLLASKAVVADGAEKREGSSAAAPALEQEIAPKPQSQKKNEADTGSSSASPQKPALLPSSLSSGKARGKRGKQESGASAGSIKAPKSPLSPELTPAEDAPQLPSAVSSDSSEHRPAGRSSCQGMHREAGGCPSQAVGSPRPSRLSQRRRRSQRLATCSLPDDALEKGSLPSSVTEGKVFPVSAQSQQPPKLEGPGVAHVSLEKPGPCLPLDLSRGLDLAAPPPPAEPAFRRECARTEKEDTQLVAFLSARAVAEGRAAPAAPGKKKEKEKEKREKKEKDHKSKQKKKKKKKKKSKQQEYSDCEDSSVEFLERCSSGSSLTLRSTFSEKSAAYQYPRAILSVDLSGENLSDVEFLDDSSTESLLLSGDEYNQDFDSTNFEESQDEEDALNEIVRCICELDEENGFMIQCEECLCWQHSVCMGLLEDSIPEQYICYVCRDPPGQRWSAKYLYDKDWLNNGHMCGLSFLQENYSHLNAKKIVSTHHLLADVYGVTEVLHALQLKIGILKNKHHPDLHLWACSGLRKARAEGGAGAEPRPVAVAEAVGAAGRRCRGHPQPQQKEETYITSEHSYQKPQPLGHGCRAGTDLLSSEDEESSSLEEDQEFLTGHKHCLQFSCKAAGVSERRSCAGGNAVLVCNQGRSSEEQEDTHLQWQLNLLSHIENVQNEVTSRMDLIEKEVDVLESWLDFTGELEPPEPLARLPQLKRRIKQLLLDMGKVQQVATLCSL